MKLMFHRCRMLPTLLGLMIFLGGFPTMVAPVYYPTPTAEDCSDGYCLFLYRWQSDAYPRNWDTANKDCNNRGMSLVSVMNRDVQSRVESLIQSTMTSEYIDTVWIGAKQQSTYWQYLDGRTVEDNTREMLRPYDYENLSCVYVTCTLPSVQYLTDNCAEEHGHHRTVCQFPKIVENDSTDNNTAPFNYVVYDETDDDDWFAARSRCHDDGGDLIHTSNLDDAHMGQICSSVGQDQTFWFGITRYPWKWQTSDGPVDMLYSNWIPDRDRDDYYYGCVVVDTQNNYQWDEKYCSYSFTAFICMNGSIPEKTP